MVLGKPEAGKGTRKLRRKLPKGISELPTFDYLKLPLHCRNMSKKEVKRLLKYLKWFQDIDREVKGLRMPEALMMDFIRKQARRASEQITVALDYWTDEYVPTRWAKTVYGVGTLTAARLRAYVRVDKIDHVSQLWSYAGYTPEKRRPNRGLVRELIKESKALYGMPPSPTDKHIRLVARGVGKGYEALRNRTLLYGKGIATWESLESAARVYPYNANLRAALLGFSKSIFFHSRKPECFYGQLFRWKLMREFKKNKEGKLRDAAERAYRRWRWKDTTVSYRKYLVGELSRHHIYSRCLRWTVKVFLSHYFDVAYYHEYKRLPKRPYIFDIGDGQREIPCPNWPWSNKSSK